MRSGNGATSLAAFNTLALRASCQKLVFIDAPHDFQRARELAAHHGRRLLVLGAGSNVVLAEDYPGVVALNRLAGRHIDGSQVSIAGGENWHETVMWTLAQGRFGLENLALIPGSTGAAPVQNIGAYGVELSNRFLHLDAQDLTNGRSRRFSLEDCQFRYRDSIFKNSDIGKRYCITSVTFELDTEPDLVLNYPGLAEQLAGTPDPRPLDLAHAVIRLRSTKLPDPAAQPNVGSFFKNPVVSLEKAESLRQNNLGIPTFPVGDTQIKLSAGWLIDQLGWRGKTVGGAAVSERHALVLINRGGATGQDVLTLSGQIMDTVLDTYGVPLDIEPQIVTPDSGLALD